MCPETLGGRCKPPPNCQMAQSHSPGQYAYHRESLLTPPHFPALTVPTFFCLCHQALGVALNKNRGHSGMRFECCYACKSQEGILPDGTVWNCVPLQQRLGLPTSHGS